MTRKRVRRETWPRFFRKLFTSAKMFRRLMCVLVLLAVLLVILLGRLPDIDALTDLLSTGTVRSRS
ncbi:hypothetical protein [Actinokineospora sp.]|uniref:hypothetical protein n=1 Tax=Actinokineospora sp. TaxID=1872133 RepID=UPI004037B922